MVNNVNSLYTSIMHNTLIVDNSSPEIERLYSLNLFTWVNSRLIPKDSIDQAIDYLEITKDDIDLIIVRYKENNSSQLKTLKEKLDEQGVKSPVLVVGTKSGEIADFTYIESILDIKDIVKYSAIMLKTTAASMAHLKVPDYFPIPVEFFSYITSPTFKIFKKSGEDFVLHLESDDEYTLRELDDFLKDYDTPYLYVLSDQRLHFVSYLSQEIVNQISFRELSDNDKITAADMTQFLLSKKLKKMGITPQTLKMAKRNMEVMITDSKMSPTVNSLMKKLMSNKASYLFKHSQVLVYLCMHIMDHIEWGNEEQKKTLSFVAFFHDVMLETDDQARIHSQQELDESRLTPVEKKLVLEHAQKAAEIVQKYPKAPMGADTIIRQHHGIPHGIGFSEYYSGKISPMTIVFILAEELADDILRTSPEFNIKAKIRKMRDKYPTQRFKKILDILDEIPM